MTTIPPVIDDCLAAGIVLAVDAGRLRVDAPTGAVTPALRARLVAEKPDIIAYLARRNGAPSGEFQTVPTAAPDRATLSTAGCPSIDDATAAAIRSAFQPRSGPANRERRRYPPGDGGRAWQRVLERHVEEHLPRPSPPTGTEPQNGPLTE